MKRANLVLFHNTGYPSLNILSFCPFEGVLNIGTSSKKVERGIRGRELASTGIIITRTLPRRNYQISFHLHKPTAPDTSYQQFLPEAVGALHHEYRASLVSNKFALCPKLYRPHLNPAHISSPIRIPGGYLFQMRNHPRFRAAFSKSRCSSIFFSVITP